ncbi:MAG TPA: NAD(P)/FAD-dependent oxidoreductase [Bacillota bacterium]|nr:NAD(P)/FAD-dependent oxidoreductase [Bacillota bacterium]
MTPSWDLAVIGAGPAGSTLARLVARAGARVILIEREALPRYKPCGGGVTAKAWPNLPPEAAGAIRWRVAAADLHFRGRHADMRSRGPELALVMRDEFDGVLVKAAVSAGATLREGTRVTALQDGADGVEVGFTDGRGVRARYAALAAGSLGARLFPGRAPRFIPAVEAELVGDGRMAAVSGDFSAAAAGYAWTFPKRDILSVGVASWARRPGGLPAALDGYIAAAGWSALPVRIRRGHPIPVGGSLGADDLVRGRILRIGDAGGFADPIFGEGIHYAVKSGTLAAPAVLAGDLSAYARAAESDLLARFRALAGLRHVLYGGMGAWVAAARRWPGVGAAALTWALGR